MTQIGRIPEPFFKTERELEDIVREHIKNRFNSIVVRGFGLDITVFTETDEGSARTCFFEIKVYSPASARCHIGNQRGEGNQIRLLLDDFAQAHRNTHQISLLDRSVRWILGNCSQSAGSHRSLFASCKEIQNAAMGSELRLGKQNNLRLSAFSNRWITWPELITRIEDFIPDSPDGFAVS